MHSCCADCTNHTLVGAEGAQFCAGCGHAIVEASVVGPALVAVALAGVAGYLAWEASKAVRDRLRPAAA